MNHSVAIHSALSEDFLKEIGVTPADKENVLAVASHIDTHNTLAIADFGKEVAEKTSLYMDDLLNEVSNKDLNVAGEKLTQVVIKARGINVSSLENRFSKFPIIGPYLGRLATKVTGSFMHEFNTTKAQIDSLVDEVEATQERLKKRNQTLEIMFGAVKDEFQLLGVYIAAGKIKLDEINREIEPLKKAKLSPQEAQELADLKSLSSNLDIRIGSLMALQQSALQTLPQIRVVQTSNMVLVDKYHTIKNVTVPAWKRQFMLAISLNEQKNAVSLAKTIDDTTNELLRHNADLLYTNATETATANQRLVIDLESLRYVNNALIKTVEDVIKIQSEGQTARMKAESELLTMRKDLQARLISSSQNSLIEKQA